MLVHRRWFYSSYMAQLTSRSYAVRIIEAVEVYRKNDANKDDYIAYLSEQLDDYVNECLTRKIKRADSPLSLLTSLANKGDYAKALTHIDDVTDVETQHLLKLLFEALDSIYGAAENLQTK